MSTVTSVPVAEPGAVGTVTVTLVDRSRPTVSFGRVVAASRTLTTTVWYPLGTTTPRPLVVFAHGFSVGIAPYVRVCQVWAQAGFVVAAPAFPLTDRAVAGANLDEGDMVNQPADISFVITQLLASPPTPLRGLIDPARIAVAGHSDGADTALDATYLPGDRDPRIGAAIVDAPDPLPVPAAAPRIVSHVPLLLIHGDRDQIAPFSASLRVQAQLAAPGWFLILRGADHLSPIAGPSPWTAALDQETLAFLANVFLDGPTLSPAAVAGKPVTLRPLS